LDCQELKKGKPATAELEIIRVHGGKGIRLSFRNKPTLKSSGSKEGSSQELTSIDSGPQK